MENVSYKLKELYNSQNYMEVISFHNKQHSRDDYNEWAYFYVINSLYKIKDYSNTVNLGKECLGKYKEFRRINNTVGWAIYQRFIKKFNKDTDDINNLINIVEYIDSICEQEQYSPYELSVQKIIKVIYDKPKHQINYKLGLKYLNLLDPQKLSDEEKITEIDGVERKIASDKESWYGKKCKSLYELEEYDECLKVIKDAENNLRIFHNRSDKWLKYREGCCYIKQKNLSEANKIFNDLVKSFSHWCVYDKLYEIEKLKDNFEDAVKNASIAALTDREHKLRVTLYESLADYLNVKGNIEEGEYHYNLVSLLRMEEGWKADKRIDGLIKNPDIKNLDKKETLKYLNDFWKSSKFKNEIFMEGKIDRVMEGQKSGFIIDDNKKSHYFRINNFQYKPRNINVGQRVRFIPIEGFDVKKNIASSVASDIEFIRD